MLGLNILGNIMGRVITKIAQMKQTNANDSTISSSSGALDENFSSGLALGTSSQPTLLLLSAEHGKQLLILLDRSLG